ANDAMARVQQVVQSLINQFTVELAPVISAVSKQFTDAAASSGLLEDGAGRAFDAVIRGAAFAMDAVEGLKRVFQVTGGYIAVEILRLHPDCLSLAGSILGGPIAAINAMAGQINKLPGIEIEPIVRPQALDDLVTK